MAVNHVKVTICGTEYKIASEESASYVLETAHRVDAEMNRLLSQNPRLTVSMAAVLCALDATDRAQKATDTADDLRVQLKRSLDENDELRTQISTGQLRF